jgi:hypothetical protein
MATAFISGHLDITAEEFFTHYIPEIDAALNRGDLIVVGDAGGVDATAQLYVFHRGVDHRMIVFHMFDTPRNIHGIRTSVIGGFKSDEERDEAMTKASDYDIAWVRPGREKSGTAKNIERRNKQRD